MIASVSIAARDSLRGTTIRLVSSQDRSLAVRNVHLLADAHEIDAARRIFGLQAAQRRLDIDALGQPRRQRLLVERLRRRKQQRLQQPQFLRPRCRTQRLASPSRLIVLTTTSFLAALGMVPSPSYESSCRPRSGSSIESPAMSSATTRLRR